MRILTRKIKRNIIRKNKGFGYKNDWYHYMKDRKNILDLGKLEHITNAMLNNELTKIDKQYFG